MDYRQRKYLRQQRVARLRVKEQLQNGRNISSSAVLLKSKQEDQLDSGVESSIENLTEQEAAKKDGA